MAHVSWFSLHSSVTSVPLWSWFSLESGLECTFGLIVLILVTVHVGQYYLFNLSQCIGQNFTAGRYVSIFISLSHISLEVTFDQCRVDLGTSVETAEDLLMEHEEFQIRAKVRACHCCCLEYVIQCPSVYYLLYIACPLLLLLLLLIPPSFFSPILSCTPLPSLPGSFFLFPSHLLPPLLSFPFALSPLLPLPLLLFYLPLFPFLFSPPQRIASEVESLLSNGEEMLADSHFASTELKERAWERKNLHYNLQTQVESRQKALSEAITFYQNENR